MKKELEKIPIIAFYRIDKVYKVDINDIDGNLFEIIGILEIYLKSFKQEAFERVEETR